MLGVIKGNEQMQAKVKEAVITTAIVLAVIFAARRVPVIGPMVDQAISG